MQYSFVRYHHSSFWTPFGPVGGHKRKSSRNRQRLSSAELAKAAVVAAGGEVWWDSPVPTHPPPPTPTGTNAGLTEPFLLSTPAAHRSSFAAHAYCAGAGPTEDNTGKDSCDGDVALALVRDECSSLSTEGVSMAGTGAMIASGVATEDPGHNAKPGRQLSSLRGSRPISAPARSSRVVDVGLPGSTPLQIQHIPARPCVAHPHSPSGF